MISYTSSRGVFLLVTISPIVKKKSEEGRFFSVLSLQIGYFLCGDLNPRMSLL